MTVTPTKRLIILILGITTNLSLGNMPSASAKTAENSNNLALLHNFIEFDTVNLSIKSICVQHIENNICDYLNNISKNETS